MNSGWIEKKLNGMFSDDWKKNSVHLLNGRLGLLNNQRRLDLHKYLFCNSSPLYIEKKEDIIQDNLWI